MAHPLSTRLIADRRQGPRRESERNHHYAREALLAQAIVTADCVGLKSDDPVLAALRDAVENYRRTEKEVHVDGR